MSCPGQGTGTVCPQATAVPPGPCRPRWCQRWRVMSARGPAPSQNLLADGRGGMLSAGGVGRGQVAAALAQRDRFGDTLCLAAGLGTVPCQGGEQRMPGPAGCPWDKLQTWGVREGRGHVPSPADCAPSFSPQFRENLKDVLPSLPSQDDYFLLKWLRGKPGEGTEGLGHPTGWHRAGDAGTCRAAPGLLSSQHRGREQRGQRVRWGRPRCAPRWG